MKYFIVVVSAFVVGLLSPSDGLASATIEREFRSVSLVSDEGCETTISVESDRIRVEYEESGVSSEIDVPMLAPGLLLPRRTGIGDAPTSSGGIVVISVGIGVSIADPDDSFPVHLYEIWLNLSDKSCSALVQNEEGSVLAERSCNFQDVSE